jgi:hypothetical protein
MSNSTATELSPAGASSQTTARNGTSKKEQPITRRRASSLRGEPPGDTAPSMSTMYSTAQLQNLTNTTVTVRLALTLPYPYLPLILILRLDTPSNSREATSRTQAEKSKVLLQALEIHICSTHLAQSAPRLPLRRWPLSRLPTPFESHIRRPVPLLSAASRSWRWT